MIAPVLILALFIFTRYEQYFNNTKEISHTSNRNKYIMGCRPYHMIRRVKKSTKKWTVFDLKISRRRKTPVLIQKLISGFVYIALKIRKNIRSTLKSIASTIGKIFAWVAATVLTIYLKSFGFLIGMTATPLAMATYGVNKQYPGVARSLLNYCLDSGLKYFTGPNNRDELENDSAYKQVNDQECDQMATALEEVLKDAGLQSPRIKEKILNLALSGKRNKAQEKKTSYTSNTNLVSQESYIPSETANSDIARPEAKSFTPSPMLNSNYLTSLNVNYITEISEQSLYDNDTDSQLNIKYNGSDNRFFNQRNINTNMIPKVIKPNQIPHRTEQNYNYKIENAHKSFDMDTNSYDVDKKNITQDFKDVRRYSKECKQSTLDKLSPRSCDNQFNSHENKGRNNEIPDNKSKHSYISKQGYTAKSHVSEKNNRQRIAQEFGNNQTNTNIINKGISNSKFMSFQPEINRFGLKKSKPSGSLKPQPDETMKGMRSRLLKPMMYWSHKNEKL